MPQLREKKKRDRRERIYKSAIELFGSKGYEKTTMEEIAEKSYLGVGTLYNYFGSKGDLLLSILEERWQDHAEELAKIRNKRSKDITSSINSLLSLYITSFSTYSKRVWREFLSLAFSKQPRLIAYVWEMDKAFVNQVIDVLTDLQDRGQVNSQVKIEDAAGMIHNLIITHVIKFITDEEMTLEDVRKSLRAQVKVLDKGLRAP